MIPGETEIIQTRLILEAKFVEDPLATSKTSAEIKT